MDFIHSSQFAWQGRTWHAVTVPMGRQGMYDYLKREYFPYDSETASDLLSGGTFDVSGARTFRSYVTVPSDNDQTLRLYRASDIRELRDHRTW